MKLLMSKLLDSQLLNFGVGTNLNLQLISTEPELPMVSFNGLKKTLNTSGLNKRRSIQSMLYQFKNHNNFESDNLDIDLM